MDNHDIHILAKNDYNKTQLDEACLHELFLSSNFVPIFQINLFKFSNSSIILVELASMLVQLVCLMGMMMFRGCSHVCSSGVDGDSILNNVQLGDFIFSHFRFTDWRRILLVDENGCVGTRRTSTKSFPILNRTTGQSIRTSASIPYSALLSNSSSTHPPTHWSCVPHSPRMLCSLELDHTIWVQYENWIAGKLTTSISWLNWLGKTFIICDDRCGAQQSNRCVSHQVH